MNGTSDAVRINREIADALEYAHGEGVIRRDVKRANIILQGGHGVLADFGVAHEDRITQAPFPRGHSPLNGVGEWPWGERGLALVHGSELSTDPPLPRPYSPHFEAVGHPEAGHRVEDLAREADLDPLAGEGSAPHPLTEDALVPEHGVLHQTPPTVA